MNNSKHYNYIRRTILCIAFTALLVLVLFYAGRLVERKESEQKNGTFFTEAAAGHIDGLLIGSSHVINGINPAQIYEETGRTVYNLAGHGSILPVSYWTLVNALDYCMPQVVFIDTYMLEKNYQYLDINVEGDDHSTDAAVDQLHEVFDCFPETANKKAAIADLISDPDLRKEFSLDFIKYHSRWSELTDTDYREALQRGSTSLMGAEMRYEVTDHVSTYPLLAQSDTDETDSIGKQYLRRIIELCISKGITPVVMQVPFEESEEYQRTANSAATIAAEYGVPFVNLRYVENIINNYSDLQSQTHLSAYGAYKVTQYFAQNTLQDLGLADHRGETGYEAWERAVSEWHQEILEAAQDPRDLYSALMLLQFEDLTSEIYVLNGNAAVQDTLATQELADLYNNVAGAEVWSGSEAYANLPEDAYDEAADILIYVYSKADGNLLSKLSWTNEEFVIE